MELLVNALLACRCLRGQSRQAVIGRLPSCIQGSLTMGNTPKVAVWHLVADCLAYPGGLRHLQEAVHFFEGESYARIRLDALIAELFPHGF